MLANLRYRTRQVFDAAFGVAATAVALVAIQPERNSQASSETEDRNKATIQASFDAWRAGTGTPYDLLAPDARWTIEGFSIVSKTYPTKEHFTREVVRPFNARMLSPLKPKVRSLYADGDTVIAFFSARGVARDGKPYANTYAWFLEMRGGQIIRASAFFDAIEFNELWTRVAPATGTN
ncbi:nuclear transport factor 2 family protein [Sinorhizobium mexicanum]|uniref:Nuclear transport factor 2 family protein n=1 Tax=Sinorhizobium mexicanum TaxID=375549 RepID=A0A859QJ16_9HYPH|nr:nuclear transport factor 2 family protein [Sinorhizobium mexicanum]MBP1886639.1 ketosteroid isomerase-like protein [Sinorhizobium mexicanum]QLL65862.1 nuclear transport factor 2 family protein [Sinorhizobium mexicanum]